MDSNEISELLKVASSIIAIVTVFIVVIKCAFRLSNKTEIERILMLKHLNLLDNLIGLTLISFSLTDFLYLVVFLNNDILSRLSKKWLLVFANISLLVICLIFFGLIFVIFIDKFKASARSNNKFKKFIKVFCVFCYSNMIYHFLINGIKISEDLSYSIDRIPILLLFWFIWSLGFIVLFVIMSFLCNEFHCYSSTRNNYRVTKLGSNELKNLWFLYTVKKKVYVFCEKLDEEHSHGKVLFLYFLETDTLMKYELIVQNIE